MEIYQNTSIPYDNLVQESDKLIKLQEQEVLCSWLNNFYETRHFTSSYIHYTPTVLASHHMLVPKEAITYWSFLIFFLEWVLLMATFFYFFIFQHLSIPQLGKNTYLYVKPYQKTSSKIVTGKGWGWKSTKSLSFTVVSGGIFFLGGGSIASVWGWSNGEPEAPPNAC